MSTASISACLRPNRSAITPKAMPPPAAARSQTEPRKPAMSNESCSVGSWISDARTIAYSITSKESSIHPSDAATKACRARVSASIHHVNRPSLAGPGARGLGLVIAEANSPHWNACRFEAGANLRGEVIRAGRIAVYANRIRRERHHRAVDRDDVPLLHHPYGARDDGRGIVYHRSRFATGRERSVGLVGTVGKHLRRDSQPGGAPGGQNLR